jgi:hypothetical protein
VPQLRHSAITVEPDETSSNSFSTLLHAEPGVEHEGDSAMPQFGERHPDSGLHDDLRTTGRPWRTSTTAGRHV